MKSRSRQAARQRRKEHVLGELKATAVVLMAALSLFLFYETALGAELYGPGVDPIEVSAEVATPSTAASSMEDIKWSIQLNEYYELFESMSDEDMSYLEKAVQCEAGESNLECCEATVSVILNRVLDQTIFGNVNTVKDVVLQGNQFSTKHLFARAKPSALTYEAISNVRNHGARVIRNKLAEKGWDYDSRSYLFFATNEWCQRGYATDFLFTGNEAPGQHHVIARAKQ